MKILAMCQGGHVRSVAVKYLMHYAFGRHDVLACGWESNTAETRKMLFMWSDLIIIMQGSFSEFVPREFHNKMVCYDVGQDRWGNAFHPELQSILKKMISNHAASTLKQKGGC